MCTLLIRPLLSCIEGPCELTGWHKRSMTPFIKDDGCMCILHELVRQAASGCEYVES
jgi:hypothetical protein